MAYNRENLLKRIIEIQDIVLAHQQRGVQQKWVYENIVKDRYHISYSCFNDYLAINAKAQLRELLAKKEKQQEIDNLQMKLF
jgi:hypothetical protein